MTGRLAGKVALVTGSASGIGHAIGAGFVREGARVWLLDRTSPKIVLPGQGEQDARALLADVTNESEISEAFRRIGEADGRLDVVVHCAAVQMVGSDAGIATLDRVIWDHTLNVNLTGCYLVCKYGLRLMLASAHGGSIINCGSPTGMRGSSSDFSAYSSSKGGVHALTRVLAAEYGRYGVRANTLVPGPTLTPLTAGAFEDAELRDRLIGKIPLGRLGTPDDYVGIATFLASDESRFATGAEFVVDGGYTIS